MAAPMSSQLAAEFVGTFLLVFTVGCNVLSNSKVFGGVSIACVLMVMIYAFGKISGGNFNPAVSLSLGIAKAMGCPQGKSFEDVGKFIGVQIVAGVLAGFCYKSLFGYTFNLIPSAGSSGWHACEVEALYTCILCFVVLNVAAVANDMKRDNHFYGIAIGFVVIAGAYGAGAISGGCFNPAVAIGIDVVGGANFGVGWSMFYVFAELLGAVVATALFRLVRPVAFGKKQEPYTILLAEFLGTYVLVLTVGLNVLGKSQAGALSIAAALLVMIYALFDISEAHFNPAVTLAIYARGWTRPPKEVALYMLSQILGAICAGFTYCYIYGRQSFPLGPAAGFGWAEVAIVEIIYTFVLCLVVLCVAVSPLTKVQHMFGLAIGSCITAGGFAIGSISGGSLNPAVSIGIAATQLLSRDASTTVYRQFMHAMLFSSFEFIGALLAVGAMKVTHKNEEQEARPFASQLTAEFIGTFLLVFTIGCNILSATKVWAGVSIASILMVMIYSFGKISGAHFNPAVSFTQGVVQVLGGKELLKPGQSEAARRPLGTSWRNVALLTITQIVAAITAGFCYYAVFDRAFNVAPSAGTSTFSAGMGELLYTFMLCFVVLNVTLVESSYVGLAIGFVIVAGAYGAGALSGGCFNPAVAIGIDVIGGRNFGLGWSLIYVIFEYAGALLAVGAFYIVRPGCFGKPFTMETKLTSEFIGTYILVLTVGLNVLGNSPAGAFSIAAALMCMIYSLWDVSGAEFNPAVTLAIFVSKGAPASEAKEIALKMVVQILGGVIAAWTYIGMHDYERFPLGPANGYGWMATGVAEIIFTFVLCLVVLCVAVKSPTMDGPKAGSKTPFFAFAIGSCVTVGGFAIGNISGGSLNPAVSIGIASTNFLRYSGFTQMWHAVAFAVLEFIGGVIAAKVVGFTHQSDVKAGAITGSSPIQQYKGSPHSSQTLPQTHSGGFQPQTLPPGGFSSFQHHSGTPALSGSQGLPNYSSTNLQHHPGFGNSQQLNSGMLRA